MTGCFVYADVTAYLAARAFTHGPLSYSGSVFVTKLSFPERDLNGKILFVRISFSEENRMKILLLEDDEAIGIGLRYSLENEGYTVLVSKTVKEALNMIRRETIDLYILDLTLPDGSGYDVCRKIREKGKEPVIFLTAFDDEANAVMGLEMGADDYISKPFRLRELMARIRSVMRRYSEDRNDSLIRIKNLVIHPGEAKVLKNGKEVELTAMEYRLLLVFLNNRGIVLSRNQILENIWDVSGDFVNDNTLTVYIKRLRNKIEEDMASPEYIKTVRGLGYIME